VIIEVKQVKPCLDIFSRPRGNECLEWLRHGGAKGSKTEKGENDEIAFEMVVSLVILSRGGKLGNLYEFDSLERMDLRNSQQCY
jgi:hypothetical protein